MKAGSIQIQKFREDARYAEKFRTGVSLHSHTMHSRESLGRLPGYIEMVPILSYLIEREIGREVLQTGRVFNFKKMYWTPPLSAREAFQLESQQIEKCLGLRAMVSLTDHDNIEAGLHLRMLEGTSDVPVSVEWTVPYEQTVFHMGIHNLPAARANDWMAEFEKYTAKPDTRRLRELLFELNSDPSILIVLNHPYWDVEAQGAAQHQASLTSFLDGFRAVVHALEINGMRSRRENTRVIELANETGFPIISGGDRHGCEPNVVLNLTAATGFNEFVDEVRKDRRSEIVLMPPFFEPIRIRILENTLHSLSDAPGEFGRVHWMTRFFMQHPDGTITPLTIFAGTKLERIIDRFRWASGILTSPRLRPAVRLTVLGSEEGGL